MRRLLKRIASEEGVTAIEYGLIAAMIAVALVTGVTLLEGDLIAAFNKITNRL